MKITESKLREIIRSVIKEGEFGDLGRTKAVHQDAVNLIGKLRAKFPEVNFVDYTHFDGRDRDPNFAIVQDEHMAVKDFANSNRYSEITFEHFVMASIENGMIPEELNFSKMAAKVPNDTSLLYENLNLEDIGEILVIKSAGIGYTDFYFIPN